MPWPQHQRQGFEWCYEKRKVSTEARRGLKGHAVREKKNELDGCHVAAGKVGHCKVNRRDFWWRREKKKEEKMRWKKVERKMGKVRAQGRGTGMGLWVLLPPLVAARGLASTARPALRARSQLTCPARFPKCGISPFPILS